MITKNNQMAKALFVGNKSIHTAYAGNKIVFQTKKEIIDLPGIDEDTVLIIPTGAKNVTFWVMTAGGGGQASNSPELFGDGGNSGEIYQHHIEIPKEWVSKSFTIAIGKGGQGSKGENYQDMSSFGGLTYIKTPANETIHFFGAAPVAGSQMNSKLGGVPKKHKVLDTEIPHDSFKGAASNMDAPWVGFGGGGINNIGFAKNGGNSRVWFQFNTNNKSEDNTIFDYQNRFLLFDRSTKFLIPEKAKQVEVFVFGGGGGGARGDSKRNGSNGSPGKSKSGVFNVDSKNNVIDITINKGGESGKNSSDVNQTGGTGGLSQAMYGIKSVSVLGGSGGSGFTETINPKPSSLTINGIAYPSKPNVGAAKPGEPAPMYGSGGGGGLTKGISPNDIILAKDGSNGAVILRVVF